MGRWGESVIDLTWITPAATRRLRSWRVATELESLSDHRIISMEIEYISPSVRSGSNRKKDLDGHLENSIKTCLEQPL